MTGCLAIPSSAAKVAMNEKKSRRPIRAGQAYLDAIRDDPQARQVLARTMLKLRLLAESLRAVDGMETTRDMDATRDEFQRASQRVRKAIAKLRQALREDRADTHLLIVRPRRRPHPGIHQSAALWRAALSRIRMVLADSRGYPKPRLWCAVPARQTG
jgi:hypothetical protein